MSDPLIGESGEEPGSERAGESWLRAGEAAALLGVKKSTLYAYVSRELVRVAPQAGSRRRLYSREDLLRLRARAEARRGHAAVTSGALRGREPVLDTAISSVGAEGPRYRGRSAVRLALSGAPFEEGADLLFGGEEGPWEAPEIPEGIGALKRLLRPDALPLEALPAAVIAFAQEDPLRFDPSVNGNLPRARRILRGLAASLALPRSLERFEEALKAPTMAESVATALSLRTSERARSAIDRALLLTAEHGLNASTFTARVTASTGADLYACVAAGLSSLSGPAHGGTCERVEALLDEIGRPEKAARVLGARLRRGEPTPGFGHPLYPDGDPRCPPLIGSAWELAPRSLAVRTALALCDAQELAGGAAPTVDLGLVVLCRALGAVDGSAAGIFAVGRAAGWIAHALEQRQRGSLLRPRARYVGPKEVEVELEESTSWAHQKISSPG